jgi:hypothetical protein
VALPLHAGCPLAGVPTTGVQTPAEPARLQASHVPAHAEAQQTPSVQNPLPHCEPVEQLVPGSPRQTPADPARLHDWPAEHAGAPQHTPSTQKPVAHCEASVQAAPSEAIGAHAPALQ